MTIIRQEKWSAAVDHVQELLEEYGKLGTIGMFGAMILTTYLNRYKAGERSEDLYESMTTAE